MHFEAPALDRDRGDFSSPLFAAIRDGKRSHLNDERVSSQISRKAALANQSLAKRAVDIAVTCVGLFFLWPLLLLVALMIKLDSSGPVFFRQKRYGMDGTPFMIFKFRSMRVMETNGAFVQARADDDRMTRIGRFLRRSSIDELPQLFNVLRGDMSLVGPRPHALAMDDFYAQRLPMYSDRHLVRPGLTGLAQISGLRGPTETLEAISQRLARDRVYIRTWSVWGDIKIILKTPLCLLQQKAF